MIKNTKLQKLQVEQVLSENTIAVDRAPSSTHRRRRSKKTRMADESQDFPWLRASSTNNGIKLPLKKSTNCLFSLTTGLVHSLPYKNCP